MECAMAASLLPGHAACFSGRISIASHNDAILPCSRLCASPRSHASHNAVTWASNPRAGKGKGARLLVTRAEVRSEAVDVVILTNGPGEVATWVKPVVAKLRRTAQNNAVDMRISVVLAPCPHASGGELQLLQSFEEIDRCQGPEGFLSLLLLGRTQDDWDWRRQGVCIFLDGNQFFTLVLGWRLGYKTLIYAEDAARWPGTNTAELGTLGVPMLVVLPTYFLETFRGATGGLLGLLSALPGQAGAAMAHLVNLFILNKAGFISWPNRWAGEKIVPELIGEIDPMEVAAVTAEYLNPTLSAQQVQHNPSPSPSTNCCGREQ